MMSMIRSFFAHVIPQVMRPLRILWNEMIGLLFLVIAIPFVWSAIKSFRKIEQGGDNLWGALLSVAFAAVMLFCEAVRNGRIGKVKQVYVGVGPTSRPCGLPAPRSLPGRRRPAARFRRSRCRSDSSR